MTVAQKKSYMGARAMKTVVEKMNYIGAMAHKTVVKKYPFDWDRQENADWCGTEEVQRLAGQ